VLLSPPNDSLSMLGGIVIAKSKQKQGRIAGLERGWKCHAKEGEYTSGDCKPLEEEPR
jgi:hypothetical protein